MRGAPSGENRRTGYTSSALQPNKRKGMSVSEQNPIICRLRHRAENSEDDSLFRLGEQPLTLGRSSECDLVLDHESVSRVHARFRRDGLSWMIEDLGSKNGIRVNTLRIDSQPLRNGDRIDLGSARMDVEIGPESALNRAARVVISDRAAPALHTEILELSELSSLLTGEGRPSPQRSDASTSLAEIQDNGINPREGAAHLLGIVSETAEALISCDTLDDTLERILSLVFGNVSAERGLICLYDEKSRRTEPKVMRTLDGIPDTPINISSNIVRHVLEKKQAVIVSDTQSDERFGTAESVVMMQIRSVMCAPLYREGRTAGFIYVDRQTSAAPFTLPDLHVLSALAMLSAVAIETAALRDSIRHEQELRARLARYSSPAVVEEILSASAPTVQHMNADERDVTVLFADLKGFTAMAEDMRSAEVIRILNRVFERLTEIVFDLNGTLDKFRGDGMMAFFGAPLSMSDHASRAVEAALRMQEGLSDLNKRHKSLRDLRMRIGINSGPVVVGDIGSPDRKDYTVIGDVVNIASRLETSVAESEQVVVGHETWTRVQDRFVAQALTPVRLKGKQKSEEPYLILGRR